MSETPMHQKLEIVERFYRDIWNRHDKSVIPVLLDEQFTFRGSLGQEKRGHEGFAAYVDFIHEALADYRCTIEETVSEDRKLFARMLFSGTHRGALFGFEPTGRPVSWAGAALFTFADDRIRDLWVLGDVHGLIEQLREHAED